MSLWERATKVIPGGVNSPVRSFAHVGIEPLFIDSAKGAFVKDSQGHSYIDYINSWGALIFGHAYDPVIDKVQLQLNRGTSYGLATEKEVAFAEKLVAAVPSLEMVRLVNSGTEATMSAIRLARGFTHRQKIVKFAGCYHGHNNDLLVSAGSGALTTGIPDSAGVTHGAVEDTIVIEYNDLDAVKEVFRRIGESIAAVIVEPVAANMGLVPPKEGYLAGIRDVIRQYGSLLIFDEVITGFRVAYGGAQEYYGVTPDLTCLGKVIGGGFPLAAYGGRREIMEEISPVGPVYQAGTLSGNPMAVTAGLTTLELLEKDGIYEALGEKGELFRQGLSGLARKFQIPLQITGVGSLTGLFFSEGKIDNAQDLNGINKERYRRFFKLSLDEKLLFPPSPFETTFISMAHDQEILEETLNRLESLFARL
jgi:glutamate-1-semialdehyde 2,1-aminomutase